MSTARAALTRPRRLGWKYRAADGPRQRPIMLHRALFGSIERFLGILIEHYAGAFPAWLSPEQVRIITVSDRHNEHAELVARALCDVGIRAVFSPSSEKLGAKIREAQLEKVPM